MKRKMNLTKVNANNLANNEMSKLKGGITAIKPIIDPLPGIAPIDPDPIVIIKYPPLPGIIAR